MARNVTVTFSDGSTKTYEGVPEEVTSDDFIQRARTDTPDLDITDVIREPLAAPAQTKKPKAAAPVTPVTAPSRVQPTDINSDLAPAQPEAPSAPIAPVELPQSEARQQPGVGFMEGMGNYLRGDYDESPFSKVDPEKEKEYFRRVQEHMGDKNYTEEKDRQLWLEVTGVPWEQTGMGATNPDFIKSIQEGRPIQTGLNWDEQYLPDQQAFDEAASETEQSKGVRNRFLAAYEQEAQRGFTGLVGSLLNDWTDAGKDQIMQMYPDLTEEQAEYLSDRAIRQAGIATQRALQERFEADPAWRPDDSTISNLVSGRWIPSTLATIFGSVDPSAAAMPGGSALARTGWQFPIGVASGAVEETLDYGRGLTDEISPENILINGLASSGLQGIFEAGGKLLSRNRSTSEELVEAAGEPISAEEFQSLGQRLAGATDEEVAQAFQPGTVSREQVNEFTGPSLEDTPSVRTPEEEAVLQDAIQKVAVRNNLENPEDIARAAQNEAFQLEVRRELSDRGVNDQIIMKDPSPEAPGDLLEGPAVEPQKFRAVSREAVQTKVGELTEKWKNAPEFEIVNSVDDIADEALRAEVKAQAPDAVGFYGKDGKVRLFSDNLDNADQIGPALFHEALGHHGLRQKFGDELDNLMTRLHDNSPELRAALEAWRKGPGKDYGDIPLATQIEEVLANMSEAGDTSRKLAKRTMDRIKDYLKNFARSKLGLNLEFSEREIRSILSGAHEMVTGGKDSGALGDGIRLIRTWHVSPADFDRFDSRYRSTGEGGQAYGQGHYFTESEEVRDSYFSQFSRDEILIGGKPTGVASLAGELTDRIWANNPRYQANLIGQNVLGRSTEMTWTAAKMAQELKRTPTPEELLARIGGDVEDRGLYTAAQLVTDELSKIDWSVKSVRPKTYEVELPDNGKWVLRDEPIANQPELRKMFEDDGYVFRTPDELEQLKQEIDAARTEVRYASDADYLKMEERYAILQNEMENSLPTTLKADSLEPELAAHGMSDQDVADMLRDAGFTGFKYKDGFSRSGKRVEPTYNYVVFGDDVPVITNKYMRRSSEPRKPIDLGRVTSTKDIKRVIDDMAEGHEIDPQSWDESIDLAERAGLTAEKLRRRKVVDINRFPEFAFAVGNVLQKQTDVVKDLARRIESDGGALPETSFQLQTELAKLGAILPQAQGFNSAAGRALNAIKGLKAQGRHPSQILEALADFSGKTLSSDELLKLARSINELNDPADVAKLAQDAYDPRAEDYIFSAWYNMNLLSRLSTQTNNILGTSAHLGAEMGAQHVAWALGLPSKLWGNKNRISTREIAARWAGVAMGAMQGLQHAGEAFRKGMPISGPSKEAYRPLPMWEAAQRFNQGKGANLPKVLQNTVNEAAVISELPSRMMAVTDEFFRSIAATSDYYGRAVRSVLMDEDGGTGPVAERVYSLMRQPTEDMKKAAEDYALPINAVRNYNLAKSHELARRVTFRDELTKFGKGVEKALRPKDTDSATMRAARFTGRVFVPFYRMGERMLAAENRYTPGLGLISRTNREGLKDGGAEAHTALGRQLFGLGLGYLALQQWKDGTRSGAGPSDYERRAELEESGWRANSVLLPDGKTWFRTEGLDPLNSYMNAVVTAAEMHEEGLLDTPGYSDKLYHLTTSLVNWMLSQAGVENLFRLVGGVDDPKDTGGMNATAGIVGSFATPGIVQTYNQNFSDTSVRSTRGSGTLDDRIVNRIESAFPGLSDQLPQRHGPLGTPAERRGGWLGFIFGDRFASTSDDPAISEVRRLGEDTKGKPVVGLPDRNIELRKGTGWRRPEWNAKREPSVKLDEVDYQTYVRLSGYWFKNGLTNEMSKPEYERMSDDDKRDMIKDIASKARRAARDYLFIRDAGEPDENAELIDALRENTEALINADQDTVPEDNSDGD